MLNLLGLLIYYGKMATWPLMLLFLIAVGIAKSLQLCMRVRGDACS